MNRNVWIAISSLQDREPVFHMWGLPSRTHCGARLERAVQINLDHAVAFARPCRVCWPPGTNR